MVRTSSCARISDSSGAWLWPWRLYTRVGLPALGRLVSRGWCEAGRFLGPSIEGFYRANPLRRQVELCRRRVPRSARPRRPPWKVRLGWRLVEAGLRLALPAASGFPPTSIEG